MMTVLAAICIALLVLTAAFQALDVLWDRQDKDRLKERILEFWISTSGLAFPAQLRQALDARYARMRSLQKQFQFIKLFWLFCTLLIIFTSLELPFWTDKADIQSAYKLAVEVDFEWGYRIRCAYLLTMSKKSPDELKVACDPQMRANAPPGLTIYQTREAEFQKYLSDLSTAPLLLSAIATNIISVIVVAIPLTVALLLSLNVTMWILSRITQSRLNLIFLLILDILVAICMPPLLTTSFMFLLVGAGVLVSGQVIDFASFSSANWVTLTLGMTAFLINLHFIFQALSVLLVLQFPGILAALIGFLSFISTTLWMAGDRVLEFAVDVGKVLRLDFSTDAIQSTVNWAIFTDLLFSMSYVIPSLLLVLANRNATARSMFLNLLMWIGDHSKGPLIAVSEIFSSLFTLLRKLFFGDK
jgi:hypothetical protein